MKLRARLAATVVAVAAAVGTLVTVTVPDSLGAYTARLTNTNNSVTTAPYLTCTAAATGLGSTLAWPLDDSGVLNLGLSPARDVSGNNRAGNYTLLGVQYRQASTACPRDTVNGSAYNVILNGSSGYMYYNTAFGLTNTFTESVWFNTTTTRGGRLIGFGSSATGASTQYDRMIYMSNNGTLTFAVYPNAYKTITSSAAYNDGKWHQAVATLGTTGMRLYVDGVQVAVDTTNTTAQTYNTNAMYLRVGYDNLDTWPNLPSSYYFAGGVRFADYFTSTLTPTQVTSLYLSGTGS